VTTLDEALASQPSPLAADLRAGVEAVAQQQVVRFTRYLRVVLPVDGYAFWVRADLLSPGAQFNAQRFNGTAANSPGSIKPATYLSALGSLHYRSERLQEETESYTVNEVVFTSETEVEFMNEAGPGVLFIGTFDGLRFAFSARGRLYRPQAGLFHYVGRAVYADMATQVIDSVAALDTRPVVSNSLPIWLSLAGAGGQWPTPVPNPGIPLYPSFLVPANLAPTYPFGAVHVEPSSTEAWESAPRFDAALSQSQLSYERVRVTLWGTRSDVALDWLAFVQQYLLDTDLMGVTNMPVARDEKRNQAELSTLAQKKTIEFEVNYYQARARSVGRQLITSAFTTYQFTGQPLPVPVPPSTPGTLNFSLSSNSDLLALV
jgi:hypothetical protein